MTEWSEWAVSEPPTLREQTASTLREALLNQVFQPGEKLVERKLADLTGVSRTSIREGLSQLEAEGLVRRVPGKGVFVTDLSEEEALQIYEARAILESAMARYFVERATDDQIAQLAGAIEAAEDTDAAHLARLHAEKLDAVSDIIMLGAGNEVTSQMASVLRTRVTYLRTITARVASPERRRETMRLLNGILDAFRARDADLAETLTRQYVERSARFALSVLKKSASKADPAPDEETENR